MYQCFDTVKVNKLLLGNQEKNRKYNYNVAPCIAKTVASVVKVVKIVTLLPTGLTDKKYYVIRNLWLLVMH